MRDQHLIAIERKLDQIRFEKRIGKILAVLAIVIVGTLAIQYLGGMK